MPEEIIGIFGEYINGPRAREGALWPPPERKSPIARKRLYLKTQLFLSVTKFLSLTHSTKNRIKNDAFFAEINNI